MSKNSSRGFCGFRGASKYRHFGGEVIFKFLGKSKWGLSNGGLTPLSVHNRLQSCTLVAFCKGTFRRKMTTILGNRGQLWTSTLSPILLSPHLAYSPEFCVWFLWFLWFPSQPLPEQPPSSTPKSEILLSRRRLRHFTQTHAQYLAKTLQPPTVDDVCLQKTRFHANPAPGTEPCKWQANLFVCMVQTPLWKLISLFCVGFGATK